LRLDFQQTFYATLFQFLIFVNGIFSSMIFIKHRKKNELEFYTKIATEIGNAKCGLTFRGYPTVVKPTNSILSAKIIFLREERSTTQEKPAIADNRCYRS
jgi:hypothetical protein